MSKIQLFMSGSFPVLLFFFILIILQIIRFLSTDCSVRNRYKSVPRNFKGVYWLSSRFQCSYPNRFFIPFFTLSKSLQVRRGINSSMAAESQVLNRTVWILCHSPNSERAERYLFHSVQTAPHMCVTSGSKGIVLWRNRLVRLPQLLRLLLLPAVHWVSYCLP